MSIFMLSGSLSLLLSLHTITFDEVPDADFYRVYWRTLVSNPQWNNPPEVCTGSPCDVELRDPDPGNVVYFSVVAVNAVGEGPH